jgi:uncharacterized membrane protein YqjE
VANENWNEPGTTTVTPQGWRSAGTGDGGVSSWDGGWHARVREESTGELVRDLVTEAQNLAREELRLAKAELRDEAKAAGKASAAVGAGGAIAYAGLLGLMCCAIALLALVMPLWASALIVGALVLLLGGVIAMGGMAKMKRLSPMPEETTQTLKEDREWLSGTMRDVRSKRRVHT